MKLERILEMFHDFTLVSDEKTIVKDVQLVTVIDAPDMMYCRKGDFVLTSAYIFKDSVDDLSRIIQLLSEGGAAAIGIKINRFLKHIPKDVVDLANNLSFPIIFIPNQYAFADIITPVLTEILNERLAEVVQSEKTHMHYTDMLLKNRSISEMFQYLKQLIPTEFYYIDYYSGKTFGSLSIDREEISNRYTKVVYGKDGLIGKFVLDRNREEVFHAEKMAIEHCLDAVNIKVLQIIAKDLENEKYRSDLIGDICMKNINSREELSNRARIFHWDFSGDWCCVIFDIDHFKAQFRKVDVNNHKLEQKKNDIFDFIKSSFESRKIKYHYFTKSDSIIFLLSVEGVYQELKRLKQEICLPMMEGLKQHTDLTMTVAIGELQTDILNAHISYEQAQTAVKIGRILYDSNSVNLYSDIRIYQYIRDAVKREHQQIGLLQPIYQLSEYDRVNNKNYLHTLEALVNNGWNIQKTADKEYMHYNTVKYRYHKIFEILGKDCDDVQHQFDITFAYKVYQMMK